VQMMALPSQTEQSAKHIQDTLQYSFNDTSEFWGWGLSCDMKTENSFPICAVRTWCRGHIIECPLSLVDTTALSILRIT